MEANTFTNTFTFKFKLNWNNYGAHYNHSEDLIAWHEHHPLNIKISGTDGSVSHLYLGDKLVCTADTHKELKKFLRTNEECRQFLWQELDRVGYRYRKPGKFGLDTGDTYYDKEKREIRIPLYLSSLSDEDILSCRDYICCVGCIDLVELYNKLIDRGYIKEDDYPKMREDDYDEGFVDFVLNDDKMIDYLGDWAMDEAEDEYYFYL